MGLQKGQTNNRQGRPKGSRNKATRELRELVSDFLQSKMGDIDSLFDELPARDKIKFLTELLNYSLPKYNSIEFQGKGSDDGESPKNYFQRINQEIIERSKAEMEKNY